QERAARQIFLVCDRQAQSWRNVSDDFAAAWAAGASPRARPLARFVVIPVGGGETDNVAIESVALLNPPAVRGCTAQVKIKVRNHGAAPRVGLPLTVSLGGQELLTSTVNVAAGDGESVVVPVTFRSEGPTILSAELRGGGPNL